MDSTQLTPPQVTRLKADVGRQLRYLNRLCARIQQLRFPPGDPLAQAARRARDVTQDLYTCAQYCGCASGVARPPRDEQRTL